MSAHITTLRVLTVTLHASFDSCSRLIDSLEEEYKARSPYLAYLVNAHQGLLATHAHLERLVERVER